MSTNASNSANEPFFLYKFGIRVPKDVTHVRVHHSVTVIPADTFLRRRQLKEVVLSEGLREIGEKAFSGCFSMDRINFPSTLTTIGRYAFSDCVSLRVLELRKGIQDIGSNAFSRCNLLERVNFPSTLTAIGDRAFLLCVSLRVLELIGGIQRIGVGAFARCDSLERINLPSTVTAIGNSAFNNCTSLTEVKLMGGIQVIGSDAFHGCTSFERIMIPSKAFVIETRRRYCSNCCLLIDGTVTPTNVGVGQVMIASECLGSMSVTSLAEVENDINAITHGREQTTTENLEQIRALCAHYELERKKKVTTILELALWKAKVDAFDDLTAREESRVTCGAGIIIPIVLPFL